MKVEVSKTELLRALEVAERAVNPKSPLPIYAAIMLEMLPEETRLRLTGTDGEVTLTSLCDVEEGASNSGKVALIAEGFVSVVKGLKGPTIKLEADKSTLTVRSGRSRYALPLLTGEAWPVVPTVKAEWLFTVNEKELAAQLGRVLPAMAIDTSRPQICGVYWKLEGQRLSLVATDTHRLHVATARAVASTGQGTFILGAGAAKELARVLEADAECTVNTDGACVKVEGSWGTFVARLVQGNYVAYERFIPERGEFAEFDQQELSEAIKRASFVAQGCADRLVVTLGSNWGARLEAVSEKYGEAEEELAIRAGSAEEQRFAVSSRNLGAAVAAVSDSVVRLYRHPTARGILVGGDELDTYFAVCIPMRLPTDA